MRVLVQFFSYKTCVKRTDRGKWSDYEKCKRLPFCDAVLRSLQKKDSSLGQSNSYSGMLVRWYIVFLVTLLIILCGWVFALKAMRLQPDVIDITNFPVLLTTIEPHLATWCIALFVNISLYIAQNVQAISLSASMSLNNFVTSQPNFQSSWRRNRWSPSRMTLISSISAFSALMTLVNL